MQHKETHSPFLTCAFVALLGSATFIFPGTTYGFVDDPVARGTSDASKKGYDIAKESDRTDHGFSDSIVKAEMILRNEAGQETTRSFVFYTKEKENEQVGDKSLVIFKSPADVKRTALLSHAKILDPDHQWLYLPALKRVKRIASANKSGPFVGSEFAFEDFTITELNKFKYEYIEEGQFLDMDVHIIDRYPRYAKSGYSRQRIEIDKEIMQPRRIQFFDRRGGALKTLILSEYKNYDGVWRAQRMAMTNHQTGKSTDLIYEEFQFKNGLKNSDFTRNSVGRSR